MHGGHDDRRSKVGVNFFANYAHAIAYPNRSFSEGTLSQ